LDNKVFTVFHDLSSLYFHSFYDSLINCTTLMMHELQVSFDWTRVKFSSLQCLESWCNLDHNIAIMWLQLTPHQFNLNTIANLFLLSTKMIVSSMLLTLFY